ncbi:hypothetical protein R1sor_022976 [Riccia sorocarpa]|uniref:Elongator complex protein 5 n=1 Tax=Riccia sorocarpa TaxID=122646 RepID=A0ABD3GPQ9_9MARC
MADSVKRQIRDGVAEGEQVPVICLLDSWDKAASLQIFRHFMIGLCDNIVGGRAQAKGVVTVAFEQPVEVFTDEVLFQHKASSRDWFQVIDCYSDPLGWEESARDEAETEDPQPSACSCTVRDIRDLECLTTSILKRGNASLGQQTSERFAVLFDSISVLLRFHSLPAVISFLDKLRANERVSTILFLAHADLHEPRVISSLEYFSTTVISVMPLPEVSSESEDFDSFGGGSLRIRQKRRNGRVRQQIEEFHLGHSGIKLFPKEKIVPPSSGKSNVPKVQFNLELSEKEREDRANVILPFEHQGNGSETKIYDGRERARLASSLPAADKSSVHEATSKSDTPGGNVLGAIHYLRDSDDERPDSDEDPDDDLDI